MTVVKVQGGLGNQLFCVAFARSLALLQGGPVVLDVSSYGDDRYGRAFILEDLAGRIEGLRLGRHPLLADRLVSLVLRRLPLRVPGYTSEPTGPVDDAVLTGLAGRRGCFDGYWQNEAYIRDPDALVPLVRNFVSRRAAAARPIDVALHYRTYKDETAPGRGGTPGPDYFIGAIARIEAESGQVRKVHLLSDDPELALRRLGDLGREVAPLAGGGLYDDLWRLLNARALILTNSSFSWWGGYCGQADIILYPGRRGLFHYPVPSRRFICL